MFREMVVFKDKISEYGHHAEQIMQHYSDRSRAVAHIIHKAKELLQKKTADRSQMDIAFIVGLLQQKNELTLKYCVGWSPKQWILLAKKVRIATLHPIAKLFEVGAAANCAYLLLKGGVRVFSPKINPITKLRSYIYELDLTCGAVIGEASFGGISTRLQTVQAITHCEFLVIQSEDFISIDEIGGMWKMSVNAKYVFLKEIPIFKHYGDYQIYRLAQVLVVSTIPKHSNVLKKGSGCENLSFIFNGRLDIVSDINDKSILASLQKYDYFGESSILRTKFSSMAIKPSKKKTSKQRTLNLTNYHYFECFDVRSSSAIEVLVLPKKYFHLVDSTALKHLRLAYISRTKWRAERADAVYAEEEELKRERRQLVEAVHLPTRVSSIDNISKSDNLENSALSTSNAFEILDLPIINAKINPLALLATSKTSATMKANRKLLEQLHSSSRRPHTAIPSSGFSTIYGSTYRTVYCELAMNLTGSQNDRLVGYISNNSTLPVLPSPEKVAGPESLEKNELIERPLSSPTAFGMTGSQRIPSLTSYCTYAELTGDATGNKLMLRRGGGSS